RLLPSLPNVGYDSQHIRTRSSTAAAGQRASVWPTAGALGSTLAQVRAMSDLSRRDMLGAAMVAAGGLVAAAAGEARAADRPEGHSKHGDEIPTFRFALEASHAKVTEGGSAKEATVTQLPISKGLAGVSMRLKPGGLRELHWHAIAAEWAYVIKGRVRATVIDPSGDWEVQDFGPGDVWVFPRGHGHAVQGLGPDEAPLL